MARYPGTIFAQLRTLPGGHMSSFFFFRGRYIGAIADSFEMLRKK